MTRTTGILLATILAGSLATIFGVSITLALPSIQTELGIDFTGIQWIVTAYTLTLGVLILLSGVLSDRLGPKKVFVVGLALFSAASLLAGFASSLALLIALQVLLGIAAAFVVPGSLTIINTGIPEAERGRAIGLWTGAITGGAVVAPFIGGTLVEYLNWQAIFYFNVVFGALAIWASLRFIPTDTPGKKTLFDWLGMILITAGLLAITVGLLEERMPLLGAGLALAGLFLWWQFRATHPLIPQPVLTNAQVRGANLVTLFLYTALNGLIFFLVLYFQQILEYSPLRTGLALMPAPLIITFLAGPFGSWSDRTGPRLPMTIGPLVVAASFLLLTQVHADATYVYGVLPALLLNGPGMAITVAPLTKTALAVDAKHSGAASGMNNALSRLAAPIAVAGLGLWISNSLAAAFSLIMLSCAILAGASAAIALLTLRPGKPTA